MRKDSAFIVVVRVSAVLMQHKRQTAPEERTFQMRPIPTQTTSASDIPDQFVWIYLSYMPYVMFCFQTYSVDVQQAEDLTQEVFIKVFLHREQLPHIVNMAAWLKTIVRNIYVESLRQNHIQTISLEAICYAPEKLQVEPLDAHIAYCELQYEILQIFSNPLERQILIGTIYGIPQEQIAKRLHMHAGTLRTRLYRMHQKLQAALMDNF